MKKSARVKVIKDNIKKGDMVPLSDKDCAIGQYIDQVMSSKGHKIDKQGILDMPEYGIDNKSRKYGSKTHHTQGSMTIKKIVVTPNWFETSFYQKTRNQNQVTYSEVFREVVDVSIIDGELPEIQARHEQAYKNLREQILKDGAGQKDNVLKKNYTSACGWAVFDRYASPGSFRYRVTNQAMLTIKALSRTRDTRQGIFEQ